MKRAEVPTRLVVATLPLVACAGDSPPTTVVDDAFYPALGRWIETDLTVESDTCGTGEYGAPTGFVLETGGSADFILVVLDEVLEETDLTLECFLVDEQRRLDCTAEPYDLAIGGSTVRISQELVIMFSDEEHAEETWTTHVECSVTGCTSTVFATLPCGTVTVVGAEHENAG
jgi:hypothetical protein